MAKLDWDKAKKWREPAYPHMPLQEYLKELGAPMRTHPDASRWDIEKYNETIQREHEEAKQNKQAAKRRKQQEAHRKFLDTPVHCQDCGKKRRGKDMHTELCRDKKEARKHGWHYGKKFTKEEKNG